MLAPHPDKDSQATAFGCLFVTRTLQSAPCHILIFIKYPVPVCRLGIISYLCIQLKQRKRLKQTKRLWHF